MSEDDGASGGRAAGGSGPAGHGNGLRADSYVVLADVHPRIADALLQRLAEQGIAAYLAPTRPGPTAAGDQGGLIPEPRPAERVYVDRTASERARQVLAGIPVIDPAEDGSSALLPAAASEAPLDTAAVEQRWLAIVADLSTSPPDTIHTWPDAEDLGPPHRLFPGAGPGPLGTAPPADLAPAGPLPGSPRPAEQLPPGRGSSVVSPSGPPSASDGLPAATWRTWSPEPGLDGDPLGLDEHYVPPEPPPVPRPHATTVAAVLCVVAGFLLIFAPGLIGQPVDSAATGLGAVAFLGGCVALVYRLRDGRRRDDEDDGAIV